MESKGNAIANLAICTAFFISVLNFASLIGHRIGAAASGVERFVRIWTWQGPVQVPILVGTLLLVLTYELWLRKRAALVMLSSVIILQGMVNMAKGMDLVRGIPTAMVGILFLGALPEFSAPPDRKSVRRLKIATPALAGSFLFYGMVGLFLERVNLGIGGSNVYALACRAIQVAAWKSNLDFDGWMVVYKESLILLGLASLAFLLFTLFRPYREIDDVDPAKRSRARDLVKRFGSDSLAYFNLRADKRPFFYGDEMFIAYKRVGDFAVVSGDPVGPVDLVPQAMKAFKTYCREHGWRLGSVGSSGDLLPVYEEAGLKGFYLGDESLLDLSNFSLEGRKVRKLRQSINKLEKSGISIEFMFNASIPSHMRHELADISVDWRGGKEEIGYSMGLGRLMSLEDPDCLLSIAYDAGMNPIGFMYWVPIYPHIGYSLDIHRTRLDAPGAVSEFIIAKTAVYLRENGYSCLSLHFLNLSQHYREDSTEPHSLFWRPVTRAISVFFPLESLYRFDKKFSPAWKKRLILHQSSVDLLLVGLAVNSAESAFKGTKPAFHNKQRNKEKTRHAYAEK